MAAPRRAVQEMEEAVAARLAGPANQPGAMARWAEHRTLFATTPELREAHDALERFYADALTRDRAAQSVNLHRRLPRAARLGNSPGFRPDVALQAATAALEASAAAASLALSKQRGP